VRAVETLVKEREWIHFMECILWKNKWYNFYATSSDDDECSVHSTELGTGKGREADTKLISLETKKRKFANRSAVCVYAPFCVERYATLQTGIY